MNERVRQLLDLFDAFSDPEKQLAMTEILRRNPPDEPDIPVSGHDALADELFAALDTNEARSATIR